MGPDATPTPPAPPAARLAPGLRVVRRGRDHLQVGLYAGRRAVLHRTPEVERALHDLLHGDLPESVDPGVAEAVRLLEAAGCLASPAVRPPATVAVVGELPDVDVRGLLRDGGHRVVPSVDDAEVALLLVGGELDRDRLDLLIRRGTVHLVVRLVDGGAIVGPFVVPGVTACLRCVDARRAATDPDHAAVTSRYARATARPRPDGSHDVTDHALVLLAAAWAVRDVAAYVEGREPSTWSRTHHFGYEPARNTTIRWERHPECGCCWLPVT